MRLTRILLVKTFKPYWHLATFCKCHCRRPRAFSVLTEFWDCSRADMGYKARKSKRNQNIRVDNLRLLDFKNVLRS